MIGVVVCRLVILGSKTGSVFYIHFNAYERRLISLFWEGEGSQNVSDFIFRISPHRVFISLNIYFKPNCHLFNLVNGAFMSVLIIG